MDISVSDFKRIIKIVKQVKNKEINEIKERLTKLEKKLEKLENKKIKRKKNKIRCPYCGSFCVIKRGLRKTINRGDIQKYYCKNCEYKFSAYNIIEYRMRSDCSDIKLALKLRKKGLSLSQIVRKLDKRVTRQTVLRWTNKFNVQGA